MTSMIEASAEAPTVAALAAEWERIEQVPTEAYNDDLYNRQWGAVVRLIDTPSASFEDVERKLEITAHLQSERYVEEYQADLVLSILSDVRRLRAG